MSAMFRFASLCLGETEAQGEKTHMQEGIPAFREVSFQVVFVCSLGRVFAKRQLAARHPRLHEASDQLDLPLRQAEPWQFELWTESVSHQIEPMVETSACRGIHRGIIRNPGFLGGAK